MAPHTAVERDRCQGRRDMFVHKSTENDWQGDVECAASWQRRNNNQCHDSSLTTCMIPENDSLFWYIVHCDTLFSCALEIFLLTYLLTYLHVALDFLSLLLLSLLFITMWISECDSNFKESCLMNRKGDTKELHSTDRCEHVLWMLCENDTQQNYIDDEETSGIDTLHCCCYTSQTAANEQTAASWLTISCDDILLVHERTHSNKKSNWVTAVQYTTIHTTCIVFIIRPVLI